MHGLLLTCPAIQTPSLVQLMVLLLEQLIHVEIHQLHITTYTPSHGQIHTPDVI